MLKSVLTRGFSAVAALVLAAGAALAQMPEQPVVAAGRQARQQSPDLAPVGRFSSI